MTENQNSYFKDTGCNDWDVVEFYRNWIHNYQEDPSKLDYQKAKIKLINCLEDIAALSPKSEKPKSSKKSKGGCLFVLTWCRDKIKQKRKKGSTIDNIWKSVEIDVYSKKTELEKAKLKHVQISGMVRTAKENQEYASTMNKGVLLDFEGEFAERKNKRALFETPNKRPRKQDSVEKVKDFSAGYDGQILDPELFLVVTDKEYDVESSEHPFDYNEWTLKSGLKVIDLLKVAAGINGHFMRLVIADIASLCSQHINFSNHVRPEVWGIVRCGLKVAKPKWCEEHEYVEIQKAIKRRSIINPPEFIASLLKNKSLAALGKELNKIKIKELMKLNDNLEEVKQLSLISAPPDALTSFFVKILSLFHQFVFPQQSIMQQIGVSEASYGAYIIHPCIIELLTGLEGHLLYEP
ncbi:6112_t:CDS:2 [Ambispora gerdemannii]|uniref:6112_t:CDS:1 n=1 Tax=Ambispora gerdemannii TaxID=144530 RepID=A0A9N9CDU5_9GLOM|nr:6112_t:CDS:2 [Ambispora gerdemannii]